MLLTLHRIASRLQNLRLLTIGLVIIGLAGASASLFAGGGRLGHWLEPSLVLALWGMMGFSFIQLFRHIPPPVLPHDDFLTRLGTRFILFLYTLLALLELVVCALLLWMSAKLVLLT